MGNWLSFRRSKPEETVAELIKKTSEEEGYIDRYFKNQILGALDAYRRQLSKQEDIIDEATEALEKLPTKEYTLQDDDTGVLGKPDSRVQIKNRLLEIEKYLRKNGTVENEDAFHRILHEIILFAKELDKNFQVTKQDEKDSVSVLFLKIYIKLPPIKVSKILAKNSRNLSNIIRNLELIDLDQCGVEELAEIKSKNKIIDGKCSNKTINQENVSSLEVLDKTGYDSTNTKEQNKALKLENLLEETKDDPDKHSETVEELHPPADEKDVPKIKRKRTDLLETGLKKPEENSKADIIKSNLQEETTLTLNKLKEIEDNMYFHVESSQNFVEKKKNFETLSNALTAIAVENSDLDIRKNEILNKIYGCLIVEAVNYLRHTNKSLDYHRLYACRFAFPSRLQIYEDKRKEIATLENCCNDLSQEFPCFELKIKAIKKRIKEILYILENKAEKNEAIIRVLERLESVKKKITDADAPDLSSEQKLRIFNECRDQIELKISDKNDHHRIVKAKMEIISLLHSHEEIILKNYPSEVQRIKLTLNKYEEDVLQSAETYEEKNAKKLTSLLQVLKKSVRSDDEILHILTTTLELISRALKKPAEQFSGNESEKLKALSHDVRQITEDINGVKSPIDPKSFAKIMNQIFVVKENAEDISEDDSELGSQKQALLQEVFGILHRLDEFVAKAARKKPSNTISELHHHFDDFNPDVFTGPKNSREFLDIIRGRAERFEDRVKYYLGARGSVDHYVVRENLLRLLDQLDKLTCEDDEELLDRVVAVMSYIKELIKQLNLNSSSKNVDSLPELCS